MNSVLVFGVNGRLGHQIATDLSQNYNVTGVDIGKNCDVVNTYHEYSDLDDLLDIYKNQRFYAVVHCQQIKSASFIDAKLHNISLDEYRRVLSTNLDLTMFSTQAYINTVRNMPDEVKGRIINFSSTYSIISSNPSLYKNTEMGNPIHYSISKGGVHSLTKYVAAHFKEYGILCNSISPHGIENGQSQTFQENFGDRCPMGRLSEPQEVTPAVNYLLDEQNTFTNGANIPVDGGWTAC